MSDNWEDVYHCPICNTDECVPPIGSKNSPILIVGEFPGKDEIRTGKPFSGATGALFRAELSRAGLDMRRMRICNLWPHFPNKNKKCLDYGMQLVIKEAKGRKAILLVGSDVVSTFCGISVATTTGLEVTSSYFSAPLVMSCLQPAIMFHSSIGEVRLSIQKFAEKVRGLL